MNSRDQLPLLKQYYICRMIHLDSQFQLLLLTLYLIQVINLNISYSALFKEVFMKLNSLNMLVILRLKIIICLKY